MPLADAALVHAEIVVEGLQASQGSNTVQTINLFHYRRNTFASPASKAQLEAIFHTTIGTPIIAALNARWTWVRTRIRFLNDPEDAYVDFSKGTLGAITGDSMPSDKCVFLYKKTGLRLRRNRGGMFLGPVSESDTTTTSDILNAGAITRFNAIATAMIAMLTDAGGNTWTPILVSKKYSQLRTVPTTVANATLTDVDLNKAVTTLQRRKAGSIY